MSWARFSRVIVIGVLFAPACFHPNFDNTQCAPDGQCPSGRHCGPQRICELDGDLDASTGDASTAPRSCVGLPATCGASKADDCCSSREVTGGQYDRIYDTNGQMITSRDARASVSNFRLDKYEVTVGRFRAFVSAGQGTQANPPANGAGAHAKFPGSGWNETWKSNLAASTAALTAALACNKDATWTAGDEQRPMNCITWYEAMAFCIWDGGTLPTEVESNYASAGGDEQRAYPWSDPPWVLMPFDATHTIYFDEMTGKCVGGTGSTAPDCDVTDLLTVGSKPAGDGKWGQSDLAGSVREWTLDGYGNYPTSCTDCVNLTDITERTIRGGSFLGDEMDLRTNVRDHSVPSLRDRSLGVRCARAL